MAEIDYRLGDYQQNRNFAEVLANHSGGSGGGIAQDMITAEMGAGGLTSFNYRAGWNPNATVGDNYALWWVDQPWLKDYDWQVTSQVGTAHSVGPTEDNGNNPAGLTLTKAGLYLNYLEIGLGFDPQPGQLVRTEPTDFKVELSDWLFLSHTYQWWSGNGLYSGDRVSYTWLSVHTEGDVNRFPYISDLRGPQSLKPLFGYFTSVRLAT